MKSKYLILDEHLTPYKQFIATINLGIELTKAELKARQFQRMLGPIWWIIEPSLMSLVFFFVTSRLNYASEANHFAFIFIGIISWRFFSRSIENSSTSYLGYAYVIRQVYFPLLAVNVANLLTEFVFYCCGLLFLIVFGVALGKIQIGATYLVLPLLIVSQAIFTLGIMIFVACIGVYIRDIAQPLAIFLNIMFFLSPGIYTADNLPSYLDFLRYVNPFFYYFPAYRSILIENSMPLMIPFILWTIVGLIICMCAIKTFYKIRPNFLRVL